MRNKMSNVLWGLFFIVIGVGFAGNIMNLWDFHLFFDGWWTLFIIVPCFISMVQSGFGSGATIGFIIGVLLLLNQQLDLDFSLWRLIIPVILVFIGVRIMFQGGFRKRIHIDENYDINGGATQGQGYNGSAKSDYSAVFSSNHVHVTDQFYYTNLSAVFGAIVLDLQDAVITGDCEINASAVFGGIDIYLPQGVRVKINNVPVFGGVSNKYMQSADPTAPTVYLNSTCMFGGIDIK